MLGIGKSVFIGVDYEGHPSHIGCKKHVFNPDIDRKPVLGTYSNSKDPVQDAAEHDVKSWSTLSAAKHFLAT